MNLKTRLARELEAINTARIQRQADQQAAAAEGLQTGAGYNPITGTAMVRDALGGVVGATQRLTNASIGIGEPVQVTRGGRRAQVDALPTGGRSGDALSSSNTARRGGTIGDSGGGGGTTFIPPGGSGGSGGGGDPNAPDRRWIRQPNGGCSQQSFAPGTAPTDSYQTEDECLRPDPTGDWDCVDGVCGLAASPGTGKYLTEAACEAARVPPPFTGGQDAGRGYRVTLTVGLTRYLIGNPPNAYNRQLATITLTGPIKSITVSSDSQGRQTVIAKHGIPEQTRQLAGASSAPNTWTASSSADYTLWTTPIVDVTVVPSNGQPDGPGQPGPTCGV